MQEYFGANLPGWEYKTIAHQSINPYLLEQDEADQYIKKNIWFDYAHDHPVKRTYYFAHCYQEGIRHVYRRNRDVNKADNIKVYKNEDVFRLKPAQITSLWKARQAVDRLCMPYDYYINTAIQYSVRRLWTFYPKLNQLYSHELMKEVLLQWERELMARIVLPDNSYYRIENFEKEYHQLRFINWLCKLISQREHPEYALYSYMYMQPYLNKQIAKHYFSEEIVTRAINMAHEDKS